MVSSENIMAAILMGAYANPAVHNIFYSGSGRATACERLNALPHWDWWPWPVQGVEGGGTTLFPLSLGCPPRRTSEGREWIAPCIGEPSQARALRMPDIYEGRTGAVLRNLQQAADATPPCRQLGPVDVQSPLGIAELLWDESFYLALIEAPAAVHVLLNNITEFLIAFLREYQRLAGERLMPVAWPPIWATGRGTMIADDTMSLVSPAMHAEFSLPYLNRIADACGPVYYHSCTWRKPHFDNIHQLRHVAAYNWNPGNSDDSADIMREFAGKAVLAPHVVLNMHKDNDVLALNHQPPFADECMFLEYLIDSVPSNGCAYFAFTNMVENKQQIEKIYDLFDKRGWSPEQRLAKI